MSLPIENEIDEEWANRSSKEDSCHSRCNQFSVKSTLIMI
jgi:hypothetical protein